MTKVRFTSEGEHYSVLISQIHKVSLLDCEDFFFTC